MLMMGIDNALAAGQLLPVPQKIKANIQSSSLKTFDHYMLVEAELIVSDQQASVDTVKTLLQL